MADRNPQNVEEARAFVAHVQSLFMPWDIPGLLAGFTDDCVIRFGDLPEFRGKAALEELFRSRSERQIGYRLRKEMRASRRHDRQLLGGRVAGQHHGQADGRTRRRNLGHARRQDRGLGSCLQLQRNW